METYLLTLQHYIVLLMFSVISAFGIVKFQIKNKIDFEKLLSKRANHLAVFFFLTYLFVMLWLSIERHASFASNYYDLAVMAQTMFNTTQNKFMLMTWEDMTNYPRFAGGMVEVIFVFVAFIYYFFSSPYALICLQTLAIAATIFPLARVAAHNSIIPGTMTLLAGILFLTSLPLQFGNLFDFHAYGFAPLACAWLVWSIIKNDGKLIAISLLFIFLIRNELALIGVGVGFYFAIKKNWLKSLSVTSISIGYYAFITQILSPLFGEVPQQMNSYSFHGHLGNNALEIFVNIVSHPVDSLALMIDSEDKKINVLRLIWNTGIIPLVFGFPILIIAMPILAVYYLSRVDLHQSIFLHYHLSYISFFLIAPILGIKFFEERIQKKSSKIAVFSLILFALGSWFFPIRTRNTYQYAKEFIIERSSNHKYHLDQLESAVDYVNKNLTYQDSLSVTEYLAAHVAHRNLMALYPNARRTADYLLIDLYPEYSGGGPGGDIRIKAKDDLNYNNVELVLNLEGVILLKRKMLISEDERNKNKKKASEIKF